ncbi:Csa1 family protein [Staphylococcus aureus]
MRLKWSIIKSFQLKKLKIKNKKEIENFKFFVQYGDFKDLSKYKDGDIIQSGGTSFISKISIN